MKDRLLEMELAFIRKYGRHSRAWELREQMRGTPAERKFRAVCLLLSIIGLFVIATLTLFGWLIRNGGVS